MNPKVQKLIDQKKDQENIKENIKRKNYLLSLGLIDTENSSYTKYYKYEWEEGCDWDEEKEQWYKPVGKLVPLDVTEEEYQQLLKYYPPTEIENDTTPVEDLTSETSWSVIITRIIKICIILQIVGWISCVFTLDGFFRWYIPLCGIILALLTYPFIFGYAKIVGAAEKYLEK